jgi:hypothetical protein
MTRQEHAPGIAVTPRARRHRRAALIGARRPQRASPEPLVRDHRDLPAPLDVLGARLRAARIRFRVVATQTGYGIELVLPRVAAKRATTLARAETIWLGTR